MPIESRRPMGIEDSGELCHRILNSRLASGGPALDEQ